MEGWVDVIEWLTYKQSRNKLLPSLNTKVCVCVRGGHHILEYADGSGITNPVSIYRICRGSYPFHCLNRCHAWFHLPTPQTPRVALFVSTPHEFQSFPCKCNISNAFVWARNVTYRMHSCEQDLHASLPSKHTDLRSHPSKCVVLFARRRVQDQRDFTFSLDTNILKKVFDVPDHNAELHYYLLFHWTRFKVVDRHLFW